MTELCRVITACRLCGSANLETVLSLGDQALTGVFRKPTDPEPIYSPLELVLCNECRFLQLRHSVNPNLMYKEYWYRSGTNQTMIDHLASVVSDVRARIQLKPGDLCLDIGCNDGTLLKAYADTKLVRIGVDPSDAINSVSDSSITTINDYFSSDSVSSALAGRKVKAITAISMIYDLDQPNSFVRDIANVLDPTGVWVVEMNYTGNMMLNLGYDMISHEHVGYYTLRTFERLISRHGLRVLDVTFNEINGGSIRIFCGLTGQQTAAVQEVKEAELRDGLEESGTYHAYANRLDEFRAKLTGFLNECRTRGEKVAVYGASTRGNTILQHCGLTSESLFAAADRNPMKWGLQTSGSKIPIWSEDDVRAVNPHYMLVLPYYFLPEFIDRERDILQKGCKFIVPLPKLRVVSLENGVIVERPV